MSISKTDLAEKITALIAQSTGKPCEISDLTALSGGANNQTWRFQVTEGPSLGAYILRMSSGSDVAAMPKHVEAKIQQAASTAGVLVAPVAWVLEPDDDFDSGYIMALVEGETIPRKILRDADFNDIRPHLAAQCGQYAAKIHAIDPKTVTELEVSPADHQIKFYKDIYLDTGLRRPVIDLAFRWLEDNCPKTEALKVVHGDFRNGNFIVGPEGIRAILDWELAHLGDPMEDLGCICVNSWRFGNSDQPVGGFGQREDMFASYEAVTGTSVDHTRVHYWQIMGTLKWGIMCMIMSKIEDSTTPLSVERAAIGRRTSETELDLLDLLTGDH